MSTFWRGLLGLIIATIASLLGTTAASPWFYVITILGITITYVGQGAFIKPISILGTIDLTDLLKGLVLTIGAAISNYAAQLVTGSFDVKVFLTVILGALVLHLGGSFATDSKDKMFTGRGEYIKYRKAAA